jgi:hypothetical protein
VDRDFYFDGSPDTDPDRQQNDVEQHADADPTHFGK